MTFFKLITPVVLISSVLLSACGGDKKSHKKNVMPQAVAASFTTQADTVLTGTLMATDADNDMLTYAVVAQPTQGMVTVNANGSFTYTPNEDVSGVDQFSFRATDRKSNSAPALVTITIDLLEVQFSDYSRAAFSRAETDKPLPLNTRAITQDVTDETAYDDLLMP